MDSRTVDRHKSMIVIALLCSAVMVAALAIPAGADGGNCTTVDKRRETGIVAGDPGATVLPVLSGGFTDPVIREPEQDSSGLSDFRVINDRGFGNQRNRYAWSMINFNGDIFVGTWNLKWVSERLIMDEDAFCMEKCSQPWWWKSEGAEVFRYDESNTGTRWTGVVEKGLVVDGIGEPHNEGLRNMVVWDDGTGSAIYGTTVNYRYGLEVWRTYDGENWQVVVGRGAEQPGGLRPSTGSRDRNVSGRGMGAFGDHLYLGTLRKKGAELWRTAKASHGTVWERVLDTADLEPDSPLNEKPYAVTDLCSFDEDGDGPLPPAMFVGTRKRGGFSVYKTYDGLDYERVAERGITDTENAGASELIVFEDRLWLFTDNLPDQGEYGTATGEGEGFDVYSSAPGEIIEGNDDWQLMIDRGFTSGGNMWSLTAEIYSNGPGDRRLYFPGFNEEGFYLYSIWNDPADAERPWKGAVEVGDGSGRPPGLVAGQLNYGVRSMEVWEGRLILGCASFEPCYVFMAE